MDKKHFNAIGKEIKIGDYAAYTQYSSGCGVVIKGMVVELSIKKSDYGWETETYSVRMVVIDGNRHYVYSPENMFKENKNEVRNITFHNLYLLFPISEEQTKNDSDYQKIFESDKYKKWIKKLNLKK